MVGASKILTVSYGTFSCTLEGFDDPFNTMKAIAEYFRDLAAGDRFFGATPPTPDADMLHRIAQREVQQRVEARVSEHGIVLRASDEGGDEAAVTQAEAARAPSIPVAATSAAALATATVAPELARAAEPEFEHVAEDAAFAEEEIFAPAATEVPAAAPAESAGDDLSDVAAKLSRIRAVIAAAQAAKAPAAPAADEAMFEDRAEIPAATFEEDAAEIAEFDAAAAIDDDFGFELELDEFPVTRASAAAEVASQPALRVVETEEPAAVIAPEGEEPSEEVEEVVAKIDAVAPEAEIDESFEAEEPVAGMEEIVAALAEPAVEAEEPVEAEAAIEVEDIEDLTGEETATEAEPEVEPKVVDLAEAAVADDTTYDEDGEDEDYAALAVATIMGADGALPSEAAPAEDLEDEDAALDALDLAGWRVDTDAAEEDEFDEFEDEDESLVAEEAAAVAAPLDLTEEADAQAEAAHEATVAERRPGFFERARARVIRIGRSAAPETEHAPVATPVAEAVAAADEEAEEAEDIEARADDFDDAREEAEHAAIFAALDDTDEDEDDFDEEAYADEDEDETLGEAFAAELEAEAFDEAEAAESEAAEADIVEEAETEEAEESDHEEAILAGIGAAISASETGEEADDEALSRELSAMARDARREAHEGRAILEDHAGDGEASVERLMEEAKSKLEGDESRRRFSAIAHLKAAVAATVADRKLKPQEMPTDTAGTPAEDIDRYREDLSKAVRPRRPVAEGAPATRRPALNERPVPLVLVSEQRVDVPAEEIRHAAAVRPRRIGATALAVPEVEDDLDDEAPLSPEEAKSFAEFADRLGATDLAELLEAAAAYTATVEGLPHFSRPQILKKVANLAEEEEFSREDGLRSFGMLLRQGKIQKISRGQFMITEASRFMSEARRAAR